MLIDACRGPEAAIRRFPHVCALTAANLLIQSRPSLPNLSASCVAVCGGPDHGWQLPKALCTRRGEFARRSLPTDSGSDRQTDRSDIAADGEAIQLLLLPVATPTPTPAPAPTALTQAPARLQTIYLEPPRNIEALWHRHMRGPFGTHPAPTAEPAPITRMASPWPWPGQPVRGSQSGCTA